MAIAHFASQTIMARRIGPPSEQLLCCCGQSIWQFMTAESGVRAVMDIIGIDCRRRIKNALNLLCASVNYSQNVERNI